MWYKHILIGEIDKIYITSFSDIKKINCKLKWEIENKRNAKYFVVFIRYYIILFKKMKLSN